MVFIDAHATDVAAAVLGAPAFLSGLTDADISIIKAQVGKRVAPEIAKAKVETLKAMQDAETGWRSAIAQISERGGLGGAHDGMVRAATAADGRSKACLKKSSSAGAPELKVLGHDQFESNQSPQR
jgi:hypothetical protein